MEGVREGEGEVEEDTNTERRHILFARVNADRGMNITKDETGNSMACSISWRTLEQWEDSEEASAPQHLILGQVGNSSHKQEQELYAAKILAIF